MVTGPDKTDPGNQILNYRSEEAQPSSVEIAKYCDGGVTVVVPPPASKSINRDTIPTVAIVLMFLSIYDFAFLSSLHRITEPLGVGILSVIAGLFNVGGLYATLTLLSPYISPQVPTRIGISRRRVFVSTRGLLMARQFSAPRTRLLEIKLNAADDRDRKKVYTISIDVQYRPPEYIRNLSQSDAVKIYEALNEAMELTAKFNVGPH